MVAFLAQYHQVIQLGLVVLIAVKLVMDMQIVGRIAGKTPMMEAF